jgi:ketosteroid isomerase-like protein
MPGANEDVVRRGYKAFGEGDETVVSTHRGTAERGGQKLDVTETLTFTIKGGKITKLVSSFSAEDDKAEDAFWGKG